VLQVGVSLFSVIISLFSVTTQGIEKAFLQNSSGQLQTQLSLRTKLNISLPEPISFSDQISSEQAFFFFQDLFSRYATLEFFPEPEVFQPPGTRLLIFKARWSFRDNRNNDQSVFEVFFLLQPENPSAEAGGRRSGMRGARPPALWKITEIKAEKI
jgi:hypothetical protein